MICYKGPIQLNKQFCVLYNSQGIFNLKGNTELSFLKFFFEKISNVYFKIGWLLWHSFETPMFEKSFACRSFKPFPRYVEELTRMHINLPRVLLQANTIFLEIWANCVRSFPFCYKKMIFFHLLKEEKLFREKRQRSVRAFLLLLTSGLKDSNARDFRRVTSAENLRKQCVKWRGGTVPQSFQCAETWDLQCKIVCLSVSVSLLEIWR